MRQSAYPIGNRMLQLYYYPGNANLAPHILLEEIGARYELMLLDRTQNAHKNPEYLKLNPHGRIPTLVDGGMVLYESAAICLHLADRHPEAELAPAIGTEARAQFYKWLVYLTNTLQAELMLYFYPERLTEDSGAASQVKSRAEARVAGMLDFCDHVLGANGGPYLLGERYCAADPYLLMLARWTRNMQQPARVRAHLGAFLEKVFACPAVQRAFASEKIEAPYF